MGAGVGEQTPPAMTLTAGDEHPPAWSMFEVVNIGLTPQVIPGRRP